MGTNTGIGIGIGIPFKNNALGGDRPYLPPELKARLIGVWDNYGKKNTDADRNIIKNKIPNAGGDLEILNSAYRLNSGFGGYSNDFQEYTYSENVVVKDNTNAIFNSRGKLLVPYSYLTKDIPSFKIKVSGLSNTYHFRYYYRDSNGVQHSVDMAKDGNYELPICYNVQSSSDGTDCGFANYGSDIVSVEILPKYEGAFVTDGVNDMIVSQNPVSEMLGGSKELTVVSMIHQITGNENYTNGYTNCIRHSGGFIRNVVAGKDGKGLNKTGIYGYTSTQLDSSNMGLGNVINNILGDKEDYAFERSSTYILDDAKYSVQNFINGEGNVSNEGSQVAWYWTFIAKRVLTTDEINQVIAYYNLDKYVKPDIYYNVKKQGLTNDTPDEDWYLKDFSGNDFLARGGRGRSGRGGRGRGMMNRIGYKTYDNYDRDEQRGYGERHRYDESRGYDGSHGYDEEERMLLMQMLGVDGNERYNDYGDEHFNKQEAKRTVDEMYHVKDGKKYIGEKYDMQKAHEVCSKFKDKLEDEVEVADVYVAINAQYHDYCELFEKWFGKGNFDDMIFESAISFWFDDVDFGEDKLWKYFNELK